MDNNNFLKTKLASMDSFYREIADNDSFTGVYSEKYQSEKKYVLFDPLTIASFFYRHGFRHLILNGNSFLVRKVGDKIIDGLQEIECAYELMDKEFFAANRDKILSAEVLNLIRDING